MKKEQVYEESRVKNISMQFACYFLKEMNLKINFLLRLRNIN